MKFEQLFQYDKKYSVSTTGHPKGLFPSLFATSSPVNGLCWNEFNGLDFDMDCVWVDSNGLY